MTHFFCLPVYKTLFHNLFTIHKSEKFTTHSNPVFIEQKLSVTVFIYYDIFNHQIFNIKYYRTFCQKIIVQNK